MSLTRLIGVVQTLNADDAFRPRFSVEQWRMLSPYMTRHELQTGHLLIRQGDDDRTLYLLEHGMVQVYVAGTVQGRRVALLRPGAIVGEAGLFSGGARGASVEALMPSCVWSLTAMRFDELSLRLPSLALEFVRAAGAVMASRMRANLVSQGPLL